MIVILLPAYNEQESLPTLLPKIDSVFKASNMAYRVIALDDGSSDRTQDMLKDYAKRMPIDVLAHKINRGLGETSRDLFERAAEICGPEDIIVRMDCDDTHEPGFTFTMIKKLEEGYDVVIASRFQPGGGQKGVSPYRAFISRGANVFMKLFFPIRGVKEYSCGFRAYRAQMIQQAIAFYGDDFIQLRGLGFTGTLEKLVKLKLLGARFAEVPFMLRYDQKRSPSKMIGSITTLGYLIMTILYHWPWGGWRVTYGKKLKQLQLTGAAKE